MNTNTVSVNSLTSFYRPAHGSVLLNGKGERVGTFDFEWSSQLLFRDMSGAIVARSDSWLGLIAPLIAEHS